MKTKTNFKSKAEQFAIDAHSGTNHFYDTYLPYEFHLRMAVMNANKFKHLLPDVNQAHAINACWLHDTIEDTRTNYSEIQAEFGAFTAEIVRAVTNYGRGRNRAERMPQECYDDINDTPCALFVKLCDRIANVQYSKMTQSSMFDKYKKEHPVFKSKLTLCGYSDMWNYLDELFQ